MKRSQDSSTKPPSTPVLAVAYIRVSTRDKQNTENQLQAVQSLITKRGWTLLDIYQDKESGANPDRREFHRMLRDAKAGRFQVVVTWSLDRFSREGAAETFEYLSQLSKSKVGFVSVTESDALDTMGPFGEVIIALLSVMAKQERIRLKERVKAGLDIAKAKGVRLGRPTVSLPLAKIKTLREEGAGVRAIARELNLAPTTVARAVKDLERKID